ncbi:hypothetical protein AAFF_G00307950 [Aldrovandia affinis]|uniref:Uncharacterized protein n=1 Tax=Aldrovandia affinis TaxID=143900 RepID=A0AAD7W0L7_9TELE|nr:hypothetical protein AAFF_G00307950 [Aldrovandia affinis]
MSSSAAELEAELSCSICLMIYRDPVLLPCGHSFCRSCVSRAWDGQGAAKRYTCPECRAEFRENPVLQRNIKLANIVEHFQASGQLSLYESAKPLHGQGGHSPGGCGHSETLERQEMIPPAVAGCPEHGEPWEYFCRRHKTCLCQSCLESHRDHSCQSLEKARAQMRVVLAEEIERLEQSRNALWGTVSWLKDAKEHLAADRSRLKRQVSELFRVVQETISAGEQGILLFIDGEENLQHARLDAHIGEMQSKRDASGQLLVEAQQLEHNNMADWDFVNSFQEMLDRLLKIDVHIQGCALKKWELDRAVVKQIEKEGQTSARRLSKMIQDRLNQGQEVLLKLPAPERAQAWRNKSKVLKAPPPLQRAVLKLDPNTAHSNLSLSGDLLSAEWVEERCAHPAHPDRFRLHPQVLCSQGFTRGQHFWEVALAGDCRWEVGATCKGSSHVDSCVAWALRWDGRRLQAFEGHARHCSPP